ncbi:MAG: recombinase family protein [Clostridiaceae bacterium]|nr:recombinase family protein [Clostridiaceae bacterium]
MPTLMYLRKSRADLEAEARGEGDTLARHEAELRRTAVRMNLTVTGIYREVVSGETIAARPQMQRLLAEVERGVWDSVLVMEVERLARGDTIDQGIVAQAFRYSGTKIVTPAKVYDPNNEFDEEYFEFGLFMSRREYKTINRRLQRGREASIREGKFCGNKTPYGYTRIKIEREKGYKLEPDPVTAPIVADIFTWYTGENRIGISRIVRKLNDAGIPTATGQAWTPATIRPILANPVYAGFIRWGNRAQVRRVENGSVIKSRPHAKDPLVVRGLHTPLISVETFELAKKYLSENPSTPGPTGQSLKNPLSGLILCGKCGRHMTRRPYQNDYPDTLMCQYTSCDTVSSFLTDVEDALLKSMREWLDDYIAETMQSEQANASSQEVAELRAGIVRIETELATLKKQESRAYDLVEQGIYTADVFFERTRDIAARRADCELRIAKLNAQLEEANRLISARSEIIPRFEKVLDTYCSTESAKEKNDLLKSVLDHAVYTKTVRTRWSPNGSDMQLKIYPKLPK